MYHFFVDPSAIGEGKVKITGADLNHMKNVLRMKTGEAVLISDGTGKDYNCQIESYAEGEGILEILSENEDSKELPSRIWLFQGLPKSDKMEVILQKAVEVEQGDTPEMLQRRVMEQAEWKILPEAIHLIANGKVHVENGHAFIENL